MVAMEPVGIIGVGPSSAVPVRAAQYVRMSTEHQQYSTLNQIDALRVYASRRGIEIARTYADEGKSGLSFNRRPALRQLIQDVVSGGADFSMILVYDVSRWGRFQDVDEAAHYEFLCRQSGIRVDYCAEQFENDGRPISAVVKSIKRAMAAEYSRELSIKVFTGQERVARLGFRLGGTAGFGMRRMQVDQFGQPRGILETGQHKAVTTDRIILVPGPPEEVELVQWMFRQCAVGRHVWNIAAKMNEAGYRTATGHRWKYPWVRAILEHEKYMGDNVWNKVSAKMEANATKNARDLWVRADGVFQPIISRGLFFKAQRAIEARKYPFPDERLLGGLRRLLYEHGRLSQGLINADKRIPSHSLYEKRFGGLLAAYERVGYKPKRNWSYLVVDRYLFDLRAKITSEVFDEVTRLGIRAEVGKDGHSLVVGEKFVILFIVLRHKRRPSGAVYWDLRPLLTWPGDLVVVMRMKEGNEVVLDYHLCPRNELTMTRAFMSDRNKLPIYEYRANSLEPLYAMLLRRDAGEGVPLRDELLRAIKQHCPNAPAS